MNGPLISDQVELVVRELADKGHVSAGQIVVFGTSTSEVVGQRIGTAGAEEIAALIYEGIQRVRREVGFHAAFQCCEHLNRALVIERELLDTPQSRGSFDLEQVSAVPTAKAGGSMAAFAYRQMRQPCLVESIQAHAGVDIGDTLIGMHLRRVAVPVRPSIRQIGEAHVTMAYTRPRYIGGPRAVYTIDQPAAESDTTCS